MFELGEDTRACVAGIGQRRQVEMGRGPVQDAEDMFTGHGQIVHGAGFDVGDP